MDGAEDSKDILAELDGSPVPRAWWPDISDALVSLERTITPVDRPILDSLVTFVARHSRFLRDQASRSAHVESPSGIHDSHPASATLFRFRSGHSHGLERLTCIGLCSLLEASGPDRENAKRLLSIVRGALRSGDSELALAFGAASSIPELVRLVDRESLSGDLSQHFAHPWNSWLRDTLVRWALRASGRLRYALEPQDLTPPIEAPHIPISLEDGQPESAADLSCFLTPASNAIEALPASIQAARGASESLERASQGDLLSSPDFRFPRAQDERLCQGAVRRARALMADSSEEAEPFVALAVALAGGLREVDLRNVVWGGEDAARPHAIDPALPVLCRRIKRPVNAVRPPETLGDCLEPSLEVMAWPLPDTVHELLRGLTQGDGPRSGDPVLPMLASSVGAPYRLRDVIDAAMPDAKVGALAPRLGLASEIARALGTEVAQLSFADTFSMPSIPAYYSAMSEAGLVEFIAQIQSRRFGEHVVTRVNRPGYLGSRLVLTDAAARRWSERLRASKRFLGHEPADLMTEWRMHRDYLAAVICSATGHRPEDALGLIFLSDVVPEHGLIILQDKQVDALRATRIAATGRLWLADLRRYLDRLVRVSKEFKGKPAGELAAAILLCKEPLLTAPTPEGATSPMTAALLRASMPPELQAVDNFYRHRLNQCLQRRQVDPELRHAQLGWVVSPAHFTADLSPRAPTDLGRELGPTIDELLVADGWYLPSARKTRWTWQDVPMPAPVDWEGQFATNKREHEEKLKRVRLQLQERWKQCEAPVLHRLGTALEELCPLLRIDPETRRLVPSVGAGGARVSMSAEHYGLICDRVRQSDQDPSSALEAVVARILLYRLIRQAKKTGLVQGPDPSRPFLSITSDPSPFIPGLGLAVRQAEAVRQELLARAHQHAVRDLGAMTLWTLLAFSAYRRMPWASAALGAARGGMRAKSRGHVVRIPAIVNGVEMPMVFSGLPATLLSRRKQHAPTARVPPPDALEAWAIAHLSGSIGWGEKGVASNRVEKTLWAAAHVELSGIERWLLRSDDRSAAESCARCIARDDDWPVQTMDAALQGPESEGGRRQPAITEPDVRTGEPATRRRDYLQFVGLLNKRKFGQLRASNQKSKASDGKRGWRRSLTDTLVKLRGQLHDDRNLDTLVGYTLDHLRYGSEDGGKLAHDSLQREVTQIGWPLLILLADRNLLGLTAEELSTLYRQVLLSKTDAARPYAFEEIQRFHRFMVRVHARPAVGMKELERLAGARMKSVAPGLLTEAEVTATYGALVSDNENERERPDASPDFLRLALLRQIMFLLLEASGIRPGSAYGLTLSDIHFLDSGGDFLHVRTTGEYGEAKTTTSIGFVPLEGDLWQAHREWVRAWVEEQRRAALNGHEIDMPLFARRYGEQVRFHDDHVTHRIDQLLKWASGNRRASCYWLRKVRITERYQTLQSLPDVTARDVYGMMTISGHVSIQTPIDGYINDPASLLFADLRAAVRTPRAALLAVSDLNPGPLDMAWNRAGGGDFTRISILLDRIGEMPQSPKVESRTEPPPLRRFKPFLPMHLDAFARAMHRCESRAEAILQAGITDQQADQMDDAAQEMLMRRGCAPWKLPNQTSPRATMEVPRLLAGTESLLGLLRREPSDGVKKLSRLWMEQAHIARLYDGDVLMVLTDSVAIAAVANLVDNGLAMQVATVNGRYLLKEQPRNENGNGHGAAFRWVLAIVWTFERISCSLPPASVSA